MANRMKMKQQVVAPEVPVAPPDEKTSDHSKLFPDPYSAGQTRTTHSGPISIHTTGVWKRESMIMRQAETTLIRTVRRFVQEEQDLTMERFIRRDMEDAIMREERERKSWRSRILRAFGRR
jgi:hypothetical protein